MAQEDKESPNLQKVGAFANCLVFCWGLEQFPVSSYEFLFHNGSQNHIANNNDKKVREINKGQGRHPKNTAQRGKGKKCSHSNTATGEQCKLPGSAALDKGNFWASNHMNDQSLAPERLHKPTCLEEHHKRCLPCRIKRFKWPTQ